MTLNLFWVFFPPFALLVSDVAAPTLSACHSVTCLFLCFSQSLQAKKVLFLIHGIDLQAERSYLERGAQWIMVVSEMLCVQFISIQSKLTDHYLK